MGGQFGRRRAAQLYLMRVTVSILLAHAAVDSSVTPSDFFADRPDLVLSPQGTAVLRFSTAAASLEEAEPVIVRFSGEAASVWLRWIPTAALVARIDTEVRRGVSGAHCGLISLPEQM